MVTVYISSNVATMSFVSSLRLSMFDLLLQNRSLNQWNNCSHVFSIPKKATLQRHVNQKWSVLMRVMHIPRIICQVEIEEECNAHKRMHAMAHNHPQDHTSESLLNFVVGFCNIGHNFWGLQTNPHVIGQGEQQANVSQNHSRMTKRKNSCSCLGIQLT